MVLLTFGGKKKILTAFLNSEKILNGHVRICSVWLFSLEISPLGPGPLVLSGEWVKGCWKEWNLDRSFLFNFITHSTSSSHLSLSVLKTHQADACLRAFARLSLYLESFSSDPCLAVLAHNSGLSSNVTTPKGPSQRPHSHTVILLCVLVLFFAFPWSISPHWNVRPLRAGPHLRYSYPFSPPRVMPSA